MAQHVLEKLIDHAKARFQKSSLTITPLDVEGYERVVEVQDPAVGLSAIIAIHDTTLGPALGGIRIFPYASKEEALTDVLRLAKGMTHKAAVAGVGFGGGKSVIIADPKTDKTPELLMQFGTAVEQLKGKYICAEDVGTTTADVQIIRQTTQYVVGLPHEKSSGNPALFTAWGVFRGIQSVLKQKFGSESVCGKRIAIQGLGSVGSCLADYLFWSGAELIVADPNVKAVEACVQKYGATAVSPSQILQVPCDVLAPCAMGAILDETTIPLLRCSCIAGAANNQLRVSSNADLLSQKGILYAPDFVINAGGLLNVSFEVDPQGYNPQSSRMKCHAIYDTLLTIYAVAEEKKISTHKAALLVAEERVQKGIGKRLTPPVFHHSATPLYDSL